jgi:hypothetical protein
VQRFTKVLSLFVLLVFITALVPFSFVQAQATAETEFSNTLEYLQNQLQADGGFPGLGEGSDPGTTARAIIALHAIGVDSQQFVSTDGFTPLDYLLANYTGYISDDNQLLFPGNAGLVLVALSFSQSAPDDISALILETLQEDGSFSSEASKDWNSGVATDLSQALAILGLAAHRDQIPTSAVEYLLGKQLEDGTWDNGFGSDPDTTALVVVALLSSGQVDADQAVIQKAFQYFRDTQLENAAWKPGWDEASLNVDTTGWTTLALVSAGQDLADWQVNGNSPRDALLSATQADGSIGEGLINVYSTVEGLLGFAKQALIEPLPPMVVTTNQAGLVVTLPDGSTQLRCVEFSGETISGFNLMETSNLQLETSFDPSKGNAICGIEGQGCSSDKCFCGMPDYWSYWHLGQGEWEYSSVGADTFQVTADSVDGWSWGAEPPTLVSYDDVCGENAQLFLPTMADEELQPTSSVLLPLVEGGEVEEEIPTETVTVAPEPESENNLTQYLIFAVIVIALIIVLIFVFREKREI